MAELAPLNRKQEASEIQYCSSSPFKSRKLMPETAHSEKFLNIQVLHYDLVVKLRIFSAKGVSITELQKLT